MYNVQNPSTVANNYMGQASNTLGSMQRQNRITRSGGGATVGGAMAGAMGGAAAGATLGAEIGAVGGGAGAGIGAVLGAASYLFS